MKVLAVDGDADLLDVMTYALRREGFDVAIATDATAALARWAAERPDAVVLDLGLPRGGGFELCRRIRQEAGVPILLTSASGDEDELVRGLQLGADDFMTKPLSLKLLAARLRALLRRRGDANPYERVVGEVRAGDLVLSLETHQARNRHGAAALTPLEFKVLYLLAMNEGRVIPYARLVRSEEYTSELQSRQYLVCRLLLEKTNRSSCTATTRSRGSAICRTCSPSGPTCSSGSRSSGRKTCRPLAGAELTMSHASPSAAAAG